ncbi:hypothetical protein [Altibacter sp. HG106]|uniref:hypothetical protein n=1 Tax=Altibacter sp. HG106 TaxID=3023937 RepID=UPI002350471F|nr:hypothetical protein [Altibacter sp. HG106]MDC7994474.1 hypothetical protein [Altibacter sp. HG106]
MYTKIIGQQEVDTEIENLLKDEESMDALDKYLRHDLKNPGTRSVTLSRKLKALYDSGRLYVKSK